MNEYDLLIACYKSGQISESAWQEHLRDEDFKEYYYAQIAKQFAIGNLYDAIDKI